MAESEEVQKEIAAAIPGRPSNRDVLLTYNWSRNFIYPEDILSDVKKIEELMTNRLNVRTPYFEVPKKVSHTSKREPDMTFSFTNNFQIRPENWSHAMRDKMTEWSLPDCGLVVSVSKAPLMSLRAIPEPNPLEAEVPDVNPNLPNRYKRCRSFLKEFVGLDEQQQEFVTEILVDVMTLSDSKKPGTKCVLLEGLAGTGKTRTLGCLRYIDNSHILYVAESNNLCNYVQTEFNLQTSTFCNFMMRVMNLRPNDAMTLKEATSYLPSDKMLSHVFTSVTPRSFKFLLPSAETPTSTSEQGKKKTISRRVNIIFLDEFSMFAPGTLECFVALIRTASTVLREKFIIILCGDFNHIPPVYTPSMNYKPLESICDKFVLQQQHRSEDERYLRLVNKLCSETPISPEDFLDELLQIIPRGAFSSEVNYSFPLRDVEEAYRKLTTSSNLYTWLQDVTPQFFKRILSLSIFTFTNREMHYSNLGLAFSIVSQLMEQNMSIQDIKKYISFVTFEGREPVGDKPIPENDYRIVPILPLIRFFPYRLVMRDSNDIQVPRRCLVYLVSWDLEKGRVTAYCPDVGKFLIVPRDDFTMNSSSVLLCGIPLEMAFATTFHLVQGRTMTEDVIVSLNEIDRRDLFAILTRIRRSSQISRIFLDQKKKKDIEKK